MDMSGQFPSLADVVRRHRLIDCWPTEHDRIARTNLTRECNCGWTSPDAHCTWTDHPEHVEQVWRGACMVTTVEQLDALPELSIVETRHGNVIIKLRGQWWIAGPPCPGDEAGPWTPDESVSVPYILLNHPGWKTKS